jgi:hypothetical protein
MQDAGCKRRVSRQACPEVSKGRKAAEVESKRGSSVAKRTKNRESRGLIRDRVVIFIPLTTNIDRRRP